MEERKAVMALISVTFRSRQPLLKYFHAAIVLPKAHWNLLQPYTY